MGPLGCVVCPTTTSGPHVVHERGTTCGQCHDLLYELGLRNGALAEGRHWHITNCSAVCVEEPREGDGKCKRSWARRSPALQPCSCRGSAGTDRHKDSIICFTMCRWTRSSGPGGSPRQSPELGRVVHLAPPGLFCPRGAEWCCDVARAAAIDCCSCRHHERSRRCLRR